MILRIFVLIASVTHAGCFVYAPAPTGSLPPGSEVRLHVTRTALLELPDLGRTMGPTVSGVLRAQDDRETVLAVTVGQVTQGTVLRTIGRDVTIPTQEILVMDQRRLSGTRTAVSIVGGGAVVAGLWAAFRGVRREPQLPDDPLPQEIRLPVIFAIPIGR